MPRVSVIIPTCNGVNRYVDQALASVLAQTFQDFELIIVDDASTDGTPEHVQAVISKLISSPPPPHGPRWADPPHVIYYRRETNGGPSAARNDGAKRANGEFLAFLDQDDLWEPTFLETTVTLLQAMQATTACISTGGYNVDAENRILHEVPIVSPSVPRHNQVGHFLRDGHLMSPISLLVRKSAFQAIGGFDERLRWNEDTDFSVRLYQHAGGCVAHFPKPLWRHRQYKGSACGNVNRERIFANRAYLLEKHAPSCQGSRLRKALQEEWAEFFSDRGKYAASQGAARSAREFYRQSLRLRPFSRRTWLRYLRSFVPF